MLQMDTDAIGKILAGMRKIYLQAGDKIIFVVDEGYQNAPIKEVFSGYDYDVVYIPKVKSPGENYEIDEALVTGKTVCWLITSVSISHSPPSKRMIDAGLFLISNPGMTPDWAETLTSENSLACKKSADAILKAIGGDIGGTFHITSPAGTNLWLKVPAGNWEKEIGKREGMGTNGPFGELCTAPYQANGRIVLSPGDFLTNPINEINKKIIINIRDNIVQDITGHDQAEQLCNLLNAPENPLAFNLGEFAIQLNPGTPKKVYRSVIAEKVIGGVHIAIGTNSLCLKETCPELHLFKNGRYNAGVHIDVIQYGTSVKFIDCANAEKGNGRVVPIIRDGKLLF